MYIHCEKYSLSLSQDAAEILTVLSEVVESSSLACSESSAMATDTETGINQPSTLVISV